MTNFEPEFTADEPIKDQALNPEHYFSENLTQLKSRLKQEVKKFSHNELARQYVSMYTTLIVLNKDYMELQKVLRSKEQLAELLKTAEQIEFNKQSSGMLNSLMNKLNSLVSMLNSTINKLNQ